MDIETRRILVEISQELKKNNELKGEIRDALKNIVCILGSR